MQFLKKTKIHITYDHNQVVQSSDILLILYEENKGHSSYTWLG